MTLETGLRKFRRAIIIGMGGSGQKVLVNLKRMFIDNYGMIPPCIQLIAFDTTSVKDRVYSLRKKKDIELSDNEFFYMQCIDPVQFIKSSAHVQEWFIPMKIASISSGAHGVRQVGRIGMYANIDMVKTKIQKAFDKIMGFETSNEMEEHGWDVDLNKQPEFYLASSLAGGTGSGTFIDLALLARTIMPTAVISGYFILPWIYTQYPATSRVRGNAYAALKELEYLMGMELSKTSDIKINFGNLSREVDRPPFDLFHLIDGRNLQGACIKDPQKLASVIADGLFLMLSSAGGDIASDTIDNLLQMLGDIPLKIWGDKIARFTSLGTATLKYPAEELHTIKYLKDFRYLIHSLRSTASEVIEVPNQQYIQNSVNKFIDRNGLYCNKETSIEEKIINIEDLELNVRLNENTPFSKSRIIALLNNRAFIKEEDLKEATEGAENRTTDEISYLRNKINSYIFKNKEKERNAEVNPGFTKNLLKKITSRMQDLRQEFEKDKALCQKKIKDCGHQKDILQKEVESIKFFYSKSQKRITCQAYMDNLNEINQAKARIVQIDLCLKIVDSVIDIFEKELPEFQSASASLNKENEILNRIEDQVEIDLNAAEKNLKNLESALFTRIVMPGDEEFFKKLDSITSIAPEDLFVKLEKTRPVFFEQNLNEIYNDLIRVLQEENQWILKPDVCEIMVKLHSNEFNLHLTRLMQLSQPMLKFDRGQLSEVRQSHIVPISIIALPDLKYRDKIDSVLGSIRNNYSLTYEPNYVQSNTEQDFGASKYCLSIVNYFSAVPAYALEDINDFKQNYEATLNPSCHIGRDYEFITEDLFPEELISSQAFKMLTFALIPELNIIKDDKLEKGHLYTIPSDLIDEEEPLLYTTFIELLQDLQADDELVVALKSALIKSSEKNEEDGRDSKAKIPGYVESYMEEMKKRFNSRDFTKVITGRFYAHEIKYLEEYLYYTAKRRIKRKEDAVTLKKYLQGNLPII